MILIDKYTANGEQWASASLFCFDASSPVPALHRHGGLGSRSVGFTFASFLFFAFGLVFNVRYWHVPNHLFLPLLAESDRLLPLACCLHPSSRSIIQYHYSGDSKHFSYYHSMSVAAVVEKPSVVSSLSDASRRKRRLSVQFQETTDDDVVEVTTKYPKGFFYTRAETDR